MKYIRRTLIGAALASLCLSSAQAAPKPAKAAAPAAEAQSAEIELVHNLGADKGAQLQKLVDRYNAANPQARIVVHERAWNAGPLPTLMILGEDDLPQFLSGAPEGPI